jgi:hypothetical protein
MQIIICIDDTDIIGSRGTGELAEMIAQEIEAQGWGKSFGVTRHQLLVHEDIPYTSHNSAMCFKAKIKKEYLQSIMNYAKDFLERESAEGSDPGLCIVDMDALSDQQKLIAFGQQAKKVVLTKEDAYSLAKEMNIHLSEHGGTGQGIIGALAGAGLRLSGNDGRFKGRHKIKENVITVKEICTYPGIDVVKSLDGQILNDEEMIFLEDKVKTVLLQDRAVLLVYQDGTHLEGPVWRNCTKQQLRNY